MKFPFAILVLLVLVGCQTAKLSSISTAKTVDPIAFIQSHDNKSLERALNAGQDRDLVNDAYWDLLGCASTSRNIDTVRILLNHGADPNGTFRNRLRCPLNIAVQNGDVEIVRLLLESGADARKYASLQFLVEKNNGPEIAEMLLAFHADPNGNGWNDMTLLESAAQSSPWLVRVLLEAGADPNRTSNGHSPLQMAISRSNQASVDLLLKHGAIKRPIYLPHTNRSLDSGDLVPLLKKYGAKRSG